MEERVMEWVYDSVMGHLQEAYRCNQVENLFEEGKPCMKHYSDMLDAYWRLCQRLGVEEDADGEIMINSLLEITKLVACKMFEYGAKLG